jgi:uncharacterized protein (DUF4213/DUF364 family)
LKLYDKLLNTIPDGEVIKVRIGLHWTGVVVVVDGEKRMGLASTLEGDHTHSGSPQIPRAGKLESLTGKELAAMVKEPVPIRVSLGMAAINALLPRQPDRWADRNAEDVILANGIGKRVVLIGHFPFVPRLKEKIDNFYVIEQNPSDGDYPEKTAPILIPDAQVVAITGMTILNGTFEKLMGYCRPDATVLVLGPSTPLSPIMFDYGVSYLSGSIVTDITPVIRTICQGASFRQVHRAGVRLVTQVRPGLDERFVS